MDNTKYLLITKYDDFTIDRKNDLSIIGLPERNKNTISKLKKGDKIIFYISGISAFGGIAEIQNDKGFIERKKIWSDEYELFPSRIYSKKILLYNKDSQLPSIKNIKEKLSFIKNKTNWGVYLQGSIRKISDEDYEIIEKFMKENLII